MKKAWLINTILIVLCGVMITGCSTLPSSRSSRGDDDIPASARPLNVASVLRFDDVPVPNGFKINPEESFAFQTQLQRVGLLKYTGSANVDQVVAFYKEQMALYNWDLINVIEYGRRILNFEKTDQTCIVTIENASLRRLELIIAIAPKGKKSKDLP